MTKTSDIIHVKEMKFIWNNNSLLCNVIYFYFLILVVDVGQIGEFEEN